MTYKEEIKQFKKMIDDMYNTFKAKRHDYGASTTESFNEFGPISMYIRMYDKMSRFKTLMNKDTDEFKVRESIYDTLLDLANYALITVLEYQNFIELQERAAFINELANNIEIGVKDET